MKLSFRRIRMRIQNRLIDDGWSMTYARNFAEKKDNQLLLKTLFKSLINDYKKRAMMKFLKKYKEKRKKKINKKKFIVG